MRHNDELTPQERSQLAADAGMNLARLAFELHRRYDLCPKCVMGLLLAAMDTIIDDQKAANRSTLN